MTRGRFEAQVGERGALVVGDPEEVAAKIVRHGEALGLRLMAINASSVVMPMLFGTAGAVIGVAGVFWVVGGLVGAGAHMASQIRVGRKP